MGKLEYYIGWDVGAWYCPNSKNSSRSTDAIVILDGNLNPVGTPWEGNLKENINVIQTAEGWIDSLFALCGMPNRDPSTNVCLAIDTPLGFPNDFVSLIGTQDFKTKQMGKESISNSYLYRETEMFLFQQTSKRPLSSVVHMIGSQATKGIHTLKTLNAQIDKCGVWKSGDFLTLIEAYPAVNNKSNSISILQDQSSLFTRYSGDIKDAWSCALTAYLYVQSPDTLSHPGSSVSELEGWIWVPKDALYGK